jgi:hypothetical protein
MQVAFNTIFSMMFLYSIVYSNSISNSNDLDLKSNKEKDLGNRSTFNSLFCFSQLLFPSEYDRSPISCVSSNRLSPRSI